MNPRSTNRAVDLVHLSRMSGADPALEQEVLQLFLGQAAAALASLRRSQPAQWGEIAHALKGAASAVGAWRVATAAEVLERPTAQTRAALQDLEAAIAEAERLIRDLLGNQPAHTGAR